MSIAYNHVTVMGVLTRDPAMKTVGVTGAKLACLSLCVNEKRKTADGKVIDNPVFVDVDAWSKIADICEKYLKKRSLVFVDGTLQMAQWEKDGVKHQKLKIRAKNIKILDKMDRGVRRSPESEQSSSGAEMPHAEAETFVPEDTQDAEIEAAMSGW